MPRLVNCSKPPEPVVINFTVEEAKSLGLKVVESDQTTVVVDAKGMKRRKPGKLTVVEPLRVYVGHPADVSPGVVKTPQVQRAINLRKLRIDDAKQDTKPADKKRTGGKPKQASDGDK